MGYDKGFYEAFLGFTRFRFTACWGLFNLGLLTVLQDFGLGESFDLGF